MALQLSRRSSHPPPRQTKPARVSYVDWVARQWGLIPSCYPRLDGCGPTVLMWLFFLLLRKHKKTSNKRWNLFCSRVPPLGFSQTDLPPLVTSPSLSALISRHKHGESYGWQLSRSVRRGRPGSRFTRPPRAANTLGITQTQTLKHYLTRFQISCRGFFDYVQKRKTSQVKVGVCLWGGLGLGRGRENYFWRCLRGWRNSCVVGKRRCGLTSPQVAS